MPDQSRRWPSERKPLALRANDFDPRRTRRALDDLRGRLDAWAPRVLARLSALRLEAEPAAVDHGDAVPVRFVMRGSSDAAAASLVLRVEPDRVRAGLDLPGAQARAAHARVADPARAPDLETALGLLPEEFTMGASSEARDVPASSAAEVRRLLEQVGASAGGPGKPARAWIGWTVPKPIALENAALLDELLEDALVALAPLFALLADAPGRGDRASRKGRRPAAATGKKKSRARGRDREPEIAEPEVDADVDAEAAESEAAPLMPLRALREASLKRRADDKALLRPRRRPLRAAEVVIEKGAKVRVVKGPFAGKVGVVHELDTKGGARVMLGLLAVRIETTHLMPCVEDRGRPVLSSSHRKPIPARS
ncbi:MAG TPA: hypothetical protein VHV30_04795 [Polyangiaceae bacterium]|nr:hypothetical protein [Polyangiaceae bacterium]